MKMESLRESLSRKGLKNVKTVIQSGNILLNSCLTKNELKVCIEAVISSDFSIDTKAFVLQPHELQNAIENIPFYSSATDEKNLNLTFVDKTFNEDEWTGIISNALSKEKFVIKNQILYLYTPEGYHKSRLNTQFIESKLKSNATNRNLKTIKKILDHVSQHN